MLLRTIGQTRSTPVAQSNVETKSVQTPSVQTNRRNPYVYALDPIRVITALSVLSVHVIGFSAVLNTSELGRDIQLGAGSALHFTREIFMFTTAFVLVYTYAGTNFNLRTYVRKRGVTVFVPYVFWSAVYVAFNAWLAETSLSAPQFAITMVKDVLTGNASYQLYYILLTLQFYALFPLLLRLLPWIRRYMRSVLTISLAVEMVVLALDFVFVENMHAPSVLPNGWGTRIDFYLHRFVLAYQFYFMLGIVAALHFDRVSAFLLAHGREIVAAFVLVLGAYWFNFAFSVGMGHNSADYAVAVLQPAMVPYSMVVLAFLGYLACRWAPLQRTGETSTKPRGAQMWHTLADTTFGIYLVHPLFLTPALIFVAPALPSALPVPLRVVMLLVPVAALSVGLSLLLLKTPGLSGLVGRPSAVPMPGMLRDAIDALRGQLAVRSAGLAPARRSAQLPGLALAAQGLAQGHVQMPAPALATDLAPSRATFPLRPGASIAGRTSPRWQSLSPDVGENLWADARVDASGDPWSAASGERNGRWNVMHGPRDDTLRSAWMKQGDREQRIRRARQLRQEGWRQREIAEALGVSRSTISHWLAHSPPTGPA